ncbi:FxsA family protein [Streptomyces sp. ST2-7A]|uniref:FxsA family protein n=1 Tax=Streptomyces sp. ST2-7A TaxID=2907214 RepID=UPI001F24A477|nr:FxsA family protein [Streptomyces sp. ST2-7A]MCE7079654.1 FxsA family protein [Streptomyces sp. ST2-7A]
MTSATPQPRDPRTRRSVPPAGGSRPGRARPLVAVGVALWALTEIWLLTLLGGWAGGWAVLLALAGGFVVGSLVVRHAGRRAWNRLVESAQRQARAEQAAREGREPIDPAAEPAPGRRGGEAMTMAGGLLIMFPGLLSDLAGLLCVLPPTAALLRAGLRRVASTGRGPVGATYRDLRAANDGMRIHRPDGRVVPGEVVREEGVPSPEAPEGGDAPRSRVIREDGGPAFPGADGPDRSGG